MPVDSALPANAPTSVPASMTDTASSDTAVAIASAPANIAHNDTANDALVDATATSTTSVASSSPLKSSDADADAPAAARYSIDLQQSFPEVCQKAKSGVQTCHAVAAFVHERANMETAYSKNLLRIAQNAKADDWAPQLSRAWRVMHETLERAATERAAFASKMQLSMVSGVRAFAAQQELQVQRLVAEGTKMRTAQQHMAAALVKAKDRYDRKCADATANLRARAGDAADSITSSAATATGFTSTPLTSSVAIDANSSSSDDNAREIAEKLTAGAGQLLTKMWDSTSAFGKSALERQRSSKVDSSLEDVLAAEKSYLQTVDLVNAQRLVYEREVTENLHAFQLTEEQRIEYLKDVLLRQQRAFAETAARALALVETLRESVYSIDEIADIEDAFKQLAQLDGSDSDALDLATNAFYRRMVHIQALSEQGHTMVNVVATTFADLIAAEDAVVQSLLKQLRIHDNGGVASADLFGLTPTPTSYVAGEGASMRAGWQVARDQAQLLMNVHQEFRSLLAEPVALSLSTMRQQYENARTATHENFAKSHAVLSSECSSRTKLQQRLETRTRDFLAAFAAVQDVSAIHLSPSTITAEQAATLLLQYGNAIHDRRVESKLRHLADDMRELERRVAESDASLKDRFNTYIQDIEVFVSVYMKNEKYRLQINKSSLLAFVKAYEHQLTGALAVTTRATAIMEQIDPSRDVHEFVQSHRTPRAHSKRVVPVYHSSDVLKDALSEYYRTKASADDRRQRSEPTSELASSPQKPAKRALALDMDVVASTASNESPPSNAPSNAPSDASPITSSAEPETATASTLPAADTSESESDAQPLAMSDFQKKFQLESPEQVVESYSCALYLSNFPYHGRLYLTRDHICFTGWRDTTYVASYLDITHIEKKNTALIVPNAIELIVKGERVFFASFVFRDECFQCLQQLQAIKKGTVALLTARSATAAAGDASDAVDELLASAAPAVPAQATQSAPVEAAMETASGKSSPVSIASVAPTPPPPRDTTDAATHVDADNVESSLPVAPAGARTDEASVVATPAPVRRAPERDVVLDEYEVILDEVVRISVDFAYSTLWVKSTAFFEQLLEASGETNIRIAAWTTTPVTCTPVATPETFDGTRRVFFIHNKKYMVGPSVIPTTQEQRYRLEPNSARLVVSTSSTVTDVPYCDYFRAENRWVFSATATDGTCRLQVGIRIHWLKSTWLKKQIESAAVSEARESVKTWLAAALEAAKRPRPGPATATASTAVDTANAHPKSDAASVKRVEPASAAAATGPPTPSTTTPPPDVVQDTCHAVRVGPAPAPVSLTFALQAATLCCLLVFIFTMLRVCATLEHMELLTRESLLQQRQQQELFHDVLQAFLARDGRER